MADTYNIQVNGMAGKPITALPALDGLAATDELVAHREGGLRHIPADVLAKGIGNLLKQDPDFSVTVSNEKLTEQITEILGSTNIEASTTEIKTGDKIVVTGADGKVTQMTAEQLTAGVAALLGTTAVEDSAANISTEDKVTVTDGEGKVKAMSGQQIAEGVAEILAAGGKKFVVGMEDNRPYVEEVSSAFVSTGYVIGSENGAIYIEKVA